MLASSIASIIVLAAVGLMRYTASMDGRLSARFTDIAELGRARETIRRAMSSLVGAPDPPPDTARQPGQPDDPARDRFGAGGPGGKDKEEQSLFELGPTEAGKDGPRAPRKIEMRLKRSPLVGADVPADVIHGAFELVPYKLEPYYSEQGVQSWALLWTPLDPPGEVVVLADALQFAAWEALGDDMKWAPKLDARAVGDFPRGVHVELTSWSGARADWLFEPIVEVRENLP